MTNRKGILLAGGSGTRLHPVTKIISKQILPLYDKPMIYYSMSILMMADIKDILIISTPRDIIFFKNLFGNGKSFGIKLSYAIQEKPKGIAEALIIADEFIGKSPIALMLGDNFFYGNNLLVFWLLVGFLFGALQGKYEDMCVELTNQVIKK